MDVHAPHEPVHTWKDIFIHLAIVTVGLFIALMLEGLVEWSHHRHLVAEARENIRQEITDNLKLADADLSSLKQDEDRLRKNLVQLDEIRSTHNWNHRNLSYTLHWDSFDDSAWRSARDTGALSFMEYKQVQGLADVYGQQEIVNAFAQRLFVEQPQALSALFITKEIDKTSDSNLQQIQTRTADALINVQSMEQILTQLRQQYEDAFKGI